MRKGSVTIFALLSMMLVVSALLALLEAGRFHEMNRLVKLQTQVALESVFAEYNTYLWEEYRVLACKLDKVPSGLDIFGNKTISGEAFGINFYQFNVESVNLKGYTRLTDGNGTAFLQAVADYMEQNLLYESAKEIYDQYEGIKDIQENSTFDMKTIEEALEALENEESTKEEVSSEEVMDTSVYIGKQKDTVKKAKENLLENIQSIQRKGILSLVLEDTDQLSNESIDIHNCVSKRQLPEAYNANLEERDWYDRVLVQQYLLTYMSHFLENQEHSLQYEVEYILGGEDTEIENVKVVVNKLLLIREAMNFLYLSSSPAKIEQARMLAVAIAGTSLNPVLIEVVKTALMAAWAYAESILEIRTLLTGGKIALVKSDATWNLELTYIAEIGKGYEKAKDCKNGLDYEAFLGILLFMESETVLAKRAMDVQEFTLQKKYNNPSLHLEDWIIDVKTGVTYGYQPAFFSVHTIMPSWNYQIITEEQFGYGKR
ncbi:MAG: hypothetical protein IJO60_00460 [Agathobacter sp.]|nr:hypothetical protein [Agathobacter sp.]